MRVRREGTRSHFPAVCTQNHQKQEEEKLSRTKAALRSGMAEGIKRGELGGLSFTGFYGQGVEMLDDTRFTFQKRRYAADADVEFLPGAMGYG